MFKISKVMLNQFNSQGTAVLYADKEALTGVQKIAKKVIKDVESVFEAPVLFTNDINKLSKVAIICGTVGHSPILEQLETQGHISLKSLNNKREVYLFQTVHSPIAGVEQALIIAGSDKRGTIYGLFHLSEQLGVSPLVNWAGVKPVPQDEYSLAENYSYVSKEPSVKYRGFFINDEWPAFGTWTNHRFGGFNVNVYEYVFELLLRLKGNYLWPAMWSARFYDDGPGLANADLAHEYGVVMGASHHEPCLRYGEEYKYLRGKDSIYGDAWNFKSNREGITKFWEDGLKRSGKYESVITVGMRGEADTAIMGKGATLADNIQLLREVLQTQNELIDKYVSGNAEEAPRMLALYKEVEPFFYGDEHTEGLIDSAELENTILMLCDDNHGNLRTLPTKEMRGHKGGYGMYYHFDYHGGPISFEWVNSSYLPKIWEQMTMAYDFGVQDLWVVNVGDISTQEFPLAYFLDMAYDFEKWGTAAKDQTEVYTMQWVKQQFAGKVTADQLAAIYEIVIGYTKLAHIRRPEHMNANVYHPVQYNETKQTLERVEQLLQLAEELYKSLDKEVVESYFALVHYPAVGNLNIQKMWLLTGLNHYYAKLGLLEANKVAKVIENCILIDKELVDEYHAIDDGRWYGLGLSEHIGFKNWNEDEATLPVLMQVMPVNKPRLLVSVLGSEEYSEGSMWHKNKLKLHDYRNPNTTTATISITSLSEQETSFTIKSSQPWLSCSMYHGSLDGKAVAQQLVQLTIDRAMLTEAYCEATLEVELPLGKVTISVPVVNNRFSDLPSMTFVETEDYIAIEAEHFTQSNVAIAPRQGQFEVIKGYGKTLSAIKVFPADAYFTANVDAPSVEYGLALKQAGEYEIELYMQPSNPVSHARELLCGITLNDEDVQVISTLPDGYRVDDEQWAVGVINHIRTVKVTVHAQQGYNRLKLFAVSPGFVLEKLVVYTKGKRPAASYLGPAETYYVSQ